MFLKFGRDKMTKHKILFGVVLLIAVVSSGLNVVQVIKNKNDINAIKSYVGSVCGDEMIKKYNDLGYNSTKENYPEKAKAISEEVSKKVDNEKDVNCVTIRFLAGTNNQEEAYKKLEAFVNKGENPSLKIKGVGSLEKMSPSNLKLNNVGDVF